MRGMVGKVDILYSDAAIAPSQLPTLASVAFSPLSHFQRPFFMCRPNYFANRLLKWACAHKQMFVCVCTLSTYTESGCLWPWLHTKNIAHRKPHWESLTKAILDLPNISTQRCVLGNLCSTLLGCTCLQTGWYPASEKAPEKKETPVLPTVAMAKLRTGLRKHDREYLLPTPKMDRLWTVKPIYLIESKTVFIVRSTINLFTTEKENGLRRK